MISGFKINITGNNNSDILYKVENESVQNVIIKTTRLIFQVYTKLFLLSGRLRSIILKYLIIHLQEDIFIW